MFDSDELLDAWVANRGRYIPAEIREAYENLVMQVQPTDLDIVYIVRAIDELYGWDGQTYTNYMYTEDAQGAM